MYVILGGAYNGKRAYVENLIAQLPQKKTVFCNGVLPSEREGIQNKRFIISNFEEIILPQLHVPEEQLAHQIFDQLGRISEQAEVFCICTDMSRGVVPLEKEARQLRDTCGRLYQRLCQEAKTVIRVWYGIPQYIKGANFERTSSCNMLEN